MRTYLLSLILIIFPLTSAAFETSYSHVHIKYISDTFSDNLYAYHYRQHRHYHGEKHHYRHGRMYHTPGQGMQDQTNIQQPGSQFQLPAISPLTNPNRDVIPHGNRHFQPKHR